MERSASWTIVLCGMWPALVFWPIYADSGVCSIYRSGAASVPPQFENYMKRMPLGGLVRVCPEDGFYRVSLASPVSRDEGGICRFELSMFSEAARLPAAAGREIEFTQMFATDGPCPDQTDTRYVSTNGVSTGMFRKLVAFWSKLTAEPERLSTVLSASARSKSDAGAIALLQNVLSGPSLHKVQIESIKFVRAGASPAGMPIYDMRVVDTRTGTMLSLAFDVAERGVTIVRIAIVDR
jgi:hypothetical protein